MFFDAFLYHDISGAGTRQLAKQAIELRPAQHVRMHGGSEFVLDAAGEAASDPAGTEGSSQSLHDFLDNAAARQIESVLAEVGGVRTKAAERLGVDRTTLYRLMRKYGISEEGER